MQITPSFLPEPGILGVDESLACKFLVDTNLADCEEVAFTPARGARIYVPTGSLITSLTFHDAPYPGGPYHAAYDDTATTPVAITLTGLAADRSYPLPAKMFAAGAFKMVGNADGFVYVTRKG